MNYAQLSQAIRDYIEAGDASFVANIPNFVRAAEQKIYNMAQLPATRKTAALSLTPNVDTLALPADWLAMYSLSVVDGSGVVQFLLDKDTNYLREAFPDPTYTDVPAYYAVQNEDTVSLAPTPDAAYTVNLEYFAYPESIVTAGTTWLSENFETALLYASLIEANMYVKGEEDMTVQYKAQFDEAMAKLKVLADGKNRRDAYRAGQIRLDVR